MQMQLPFFLFLPLESYMYEKSTDFYIFESNKQRKNILYLGCKKK
jgi:hypothetical protein